MVSLLRIPPRKQKAIYTPVFTNSTFGRVEEGTPVLLNCRWDDVSDEIRDTDGAELQCNASVYPDIKTPVGGFLCEVELDAERVPVIQSWGGLTLSVTADPPTVNAFYIHLEFEQYTENSLGEWEGGFVQFANNVSGANAGLIRKILSITTNPDDDTVWKIVLQTPLPVVIGESDVDKHLNLLSVGPKSKVLKFETIRNFRGTKELYLAYI